MFIYRGRGWKKKNCGGIRGKLHSLYQVVKRVEKKGVPGADIDVFKCMNEKIKEVETIPSTISMRLLRARESMDRSLLSEDESYHLDLFLFCFYCGGIAPIDAAYLTRSCIDMKKRKITYERIKTPKKARPPFVPRAEKIAEKYRKIAIRTSCCPSSRQSMILMTRRKTGWIICALKWMKRYGAS